MHYLFTWKKESGSFDERKRAFRCLLGEPTIYHYIAHQNIYRNWRLNFMKIAMVLKGIEIDHWTENGYQYSQGKTVFYSIQYKNGRLAASDLFHMFTQSIKFYTFNYHVLRVQMLKKCDSSNRQQKRVVALFSKFYVKIWVGF